MDKIPVVHIYGQQLHHMEAIVLANHEGLLKLRDTINVVLSNPQYPEECEVYVNDGEGYSICVKLISDVDKLPVPYTADYAADKTGRRPSSFLNQDQEEPLDPELSSLAAEAREYRVSRKKIGAIDMPIAYKLADLYSTTSFCAEFIEEGLKLKENEYNKEQLEIIWDGMDALTDKYQKW